MMTFVKYPILAGLPLMASLMVSECGAKDMDVYFPTNNYNSNNPVGKENPNRNDKPGIDFLESMVVSTREKIFLDGECFEI